MSLLPGCTLPYDMDQGQTDAMDLKCKGDSNLRSNNYVDALECYIQAVKKSYDTDDKEVYAASICNIGIIYATFNDLDRAAYYFNKSFETAQSTGDNRIASICVTDMMLIAASKRDSTLMSQWIQRKRQYPLDDKEIDDFWTTYSEALIKLNTDSNAEGRALMRKVAEMSVSEKFDKEHLVMAYVDIGTSWKNDGFPDSAMNYYYKALGMSEGYINQEKEIYRNLIQLYSGREEKDSVLKYQTALLAMSDSIYDISKFNLTKNELSLYEDELSDRKLKIANERFMTLLCVSVPLAVLLIVIGCMHRKLKNALRLLWEKHNSLIAENEDSRRWKEKYYQLEEKHREHDNQIESGDDACPGESAHDISEPVGLCADSCGNQIQSAGAVKLNDSLRQHLDREIMRLLDNPEILLDPDLTINSVASELKVNSNYVSKTISETYGMNFRSFINQQKLKEVCRRLSDDRRYGNLTIAAIAADCGFRSVNNFTVIFKKFTGMTPLKYRNLAKDCAEGGCKR